MLPVAVTPVKTGDFVTPQLRTPGGSAVTTSDGMILYIVVYRTLFTESERKEPGYEDDFSLAKHALKRLYDMYLCY